jgi:hypothetical protein
MMTYSERKEMMNMKMPDEGGLSHKEMIDFWCLLYKYEDDETILKETSEEFLEMVKEWRKSQ